VSNGNSYSQIGCSGRVAEVGAGDVRQQRDAVEAHDAQLWESHRFGADEEYLQIEKLSNLAALPAPTGFQVLALPIRLERASGAWARVVALVAAD
jgi:kynurenine formamidase